MNACRRLSLLLLATLVLGHASTTSARRVVGQVVYEDQSPDLFQITGFDGVMVERPIRFADVQVFDTTLTTLLGEGQTDENGNFAIELLDHPDIRGTFPAGTVRITATSANHPVVAGQHQVTGVVAVDSFAPDGVPYTLDFPFSGFAECGEPVAPCSADIDANSIPQPAGTMPWIARMDDDLGKAFNIWDQLQDTLDFLEAVGETRDSAGLMTLAYRSDHDSDSGTKYFYGNPDIFVGADEGYDDTVVLGQLGAFLNDRFLRNDHTDLLLSAPDDPQLQFDPRDEELLPRLAFAEGLVEALSSAIRFNAGHPRPDQHVRTSGLSDGALTLRTESHEIETLTAGATALVGSRGLTNSAVVASAIWDLFDVPATDDQTPGTDDDPMSFTLLEVWAALKTAATADRVFNLENLLFTFGA
ncbi:MAG: hypothetical protein AAF533_28535, partial [Acidobacteriota bacterium]